jgi:predicted nucleotidyltransferase
MQKEFKDIVFEFAKRVSDIDTVRSVILFGSVAKGEADARSDIDILIVFDTLGSIGRIKGRREISRIALNLEKKFDKNIQIVFTNRKFDKVDRQFVEHLFSEGIVLYGSVPQIDVKKLRLEPHTLVYFSLKKLSKADKMRVKKALYGHKTIKKYKDRVYRSEIVGLVEQFGGRRTGIASVLIPAKKSKEFVEALKRFGVDYESLNVWVSQV